MARVEMRDVSLLYPGGGGVSDVDLEIEDGQFVALLGPSGSGKTTLLRLVAGFLRPGSGSVKIGGREVAGGGAWVPPERRNLGMVFQQHAVWPHKTVARNVEYPLKLSKVGRGERERRVGEVLDLVGLDGYAGRSPDTLSGGQRQRVALARALVVRPDALLLDEPFASLDAALKDRLRVQLKDLTTRTGTTVIHVTHDRAEALALADRVVVLREGRMEQAAPPRQLFDEPRTPFVARFVADAALIPVQARGANGFAPKDGPEFEVEEVLAPDGRADEGELSVRPGDVRLEAGPGGRVRAAMFAGDHVEIHLDWQDRSLRVRVPADAGWEVGDEARPVFRRAVFFADEASGIRHQVSAKQKADR